MKKHLLGLSLILLLSGCGGGDSDPAPAPETSPAVPAVPEMRLVEPSSPPQPLNGYLARTKTYQVGQSVTLSLLSPLSW